MLTTPKPTTTTTTRILLLANGALWINKSSFMIYHIYFIHSLDKQKRTQNSHMLVHIIKKESSNRKYEYEISKNEKRKKKEMKIYRIYRECIWTNMWTVFTVGPIYFNWANWMARGGPANTIWLHCLVAWIVIDKLNPHWEIAANSKHWLKTTAAWHKLYW